VVTRSTGDVDSDVERIDGWVRLSRQKESCSAKRLPARSPTAATEAEGIDLGASVLHVMITRVVGLPDEQKILRA
jgi:hypothetical protein